MMAAGRLFAPPEDNPLLKESAFPLHVTWQAGVEGDPQTDPHCLEVRHKFPFPCNMGQMQYEIGLTDIKVRYAYPLKEAKVAVTGKRGRRGVCMAVKFQTGVLNNAQDCVKYLADGANVYHNPQQHTYMRRGLYFRDLIRVVPVGKNIVRFVKNTGPGVPSNMGLNLRIHGTAGSQFLQWLDKDGTPKEESTATLEELGKCSTYTTIAPPEEDLAEFLKQEQQTSDRTTLVNSNVRYQMLETQNAFCDLDVGAFASMFVSLDVFNEDLVDAAYGDSMGPYRGRICSLPLNDMNQSCGMDIEFNLQNPDFVPLKRTVKYDTTFRIQIRRDPGVIRSPPIFKSCDMNFVVRPKINNHPL